MFNRRYVAATFVAALSFLPAAPVNAAVILITHAKANAGNVTPGDTPGYPVTISIPGSFQLDSNLFVAANKIGIQVTSKNVTVDLNGFTIEGSDVAWYGVTGGVNAVTIENGTITQFKFDGINGGAGKYWIVDTVRSIENGRNGVVIGHYTVIKSSVVVGNAGYGINAGVSSVIQGNTVSDNGITGIQTVQSTVIGNTINENESYGLAGGGYTGYSGNTLVSNNFTGGGVEAASVLPQHPNACQGACP